MKQLIVTADDLGLDRGMTEGAIRAHEAGIVRAVSVVASGREFDHAVERLREAPGLEAGVHLALVEEASLTGIALPKSYVRFMPAYLTGRLQIAAIERELRAQIEKVLSTGLRVTHLNGHQHLHSLPAIFTLVVRLAEEYGIGYVRLPADVRVSADPLRSVAVMGLNAVARRARARAARKAVTMNDATIGIAEAGHLTAAKVADLLETVPVGVTELVTHPGIGVKGYAHWRYEWDEEVRALCDPHVRATIDSLGIRLVAPSAL